MGNPDVILSDPAEPSARAVCAKSPVYIVEDDSEVRCSLSLLLRSYGHLGHPFSSAPDFLDSLSILKPGPVLLDLRMPEMNGDRLLEELQARGVRWPVIVLTGHGDVPAAVSAMKLGAFDFLEKPCSSSKLLQTIDAAMEVLDERTRESAGKQAAADLLARLRPREKAVLEHLAAGMQSKTIAASLGISVRTVEMHRANMLRRLGVRTTPEALSIAFLGGLASGSAQHV